MTTPNRPRKRLNPKMTNFRIIPSRAHPSTAIHERKNSQADWLEEIYCDLESLTTNQSSSHRRFLLDAASQYLDLIRHNLFPENEAKFAEVEQRRQTMMFLELSGSAGAPLTRRE